MKFSVIPHFFGITECFLLAGFLGFVSYVYIHIGKTERDESINSVFRNP